MTRGLLTAALAASLLGLASADVASADLSVEKTGPSRAAAGTPFAYRIEVSNEGPDAADEVVVTDALPAGTSFVSAAVEGAPGGSCQAEAGVVTCELGTVEEGPVAIDLTVVAAGPGDVENTAVVASAAEDPDPEDDASSWTVTVLPEGSTDLAVEQEAPPFAAVGSLLTYAIRVRNEGSSPAPGVVLTNTLPAGAALGSAATSHGAGCAHAAGVLTCALGTIEAGGAATATVVVTPSAEGEIVTTASVPDELDLVPEDNEAAATIEVLPAGTADVALEKALTPPVVAQGSAAVLTLRARGLGPAPAAGVTVVEPLPPGIGVLAVPPACSYVAGSHTVTCEAGPLAPGEVATADVVVSGAQLGAHESTATVSSASDPDPSNDAAAAALEVVVPVASGTTASAGTGRVHLDPDTDHPTVLVPGDHPSDLEVTTEAACPPGSSPDGPPTLSLGGFAAPMTAAGEGFRGVVPAGEVGSGGVLVTLACDGQDHVNLVATVEVFSPMGTVADVETGLPVEEATVTLHRVPGWRASTGPADLGDGACPSEASGGPWTQEPPPGLGVPVEGRSGLVDPPLNPMTTGPSGRFGWELAAGCWFVSVEAPGYLPLTGPLVGAPPAPALDLLVEPIVEPVGRSVSLEGTPKRRAFDQPLRIRGSVLSEVSACRSGVPVTIERRVLGRETFQHVTTVLTRASGAFVHPTTADRSAAYRARLEGPEGCSPARAGAVRVLVRMTVELRAGRRVVPAGRPVRLRARYEPCPGNRRLRVRLLANGKVKAATRAKGCRAVFRVPLERTTRFRALVASRRPDLEEGRSPVVRVRARR